MNARFTAFSRNVQRRNGVFLTNETRGIGDSMDQTKETSDAPPPILSQPPEEGLEEHVKRHPHDADAKVDLGSDESMDASDPSAAAQPGCDSEPAPSSGFPE